MTKFRLEWIVSSLITAAVTGVTVSAEVSRIVVPPSLADVEGRGSVSPATGPIRIQYLFPAADFAALPDTQQLIVAWNVRSDVSQPGPFDWTLDNEQIWMSTTNLSRLTSVFANNHGADKTLVHNGPMTYSLLTTGPPEGPHDFADGTRLNTPFIYDPSKGNLLIERLSFDVAGPTIDIEEITGATVLLSGNPNSATGILMGVVNIAQFEFMPLVKGDFNGDGLLDINDLNTLTTAIQVNPGDVQYDLDQSGVVDLADRQYWVSDVKKTWLGDANLDGVFDSGDMVSVFLTGEYEDALDGNSTWASGDWNGDGDFNSGDMISAFLDGGYEAGPRTAVSAVPEPSALGLLLMGGLLLVRLSRRSQTAARKRQLRFIT